MYSGKVGVILLRVIFVVPFYHNCITVTVFCVSMIIMKPNFSSCYNQDAGKARRSTR